jgi:hypothetical protein
MIVCTLLVGVTDDQTNELEHEVYNRVNIGDVLRVSLVQVTGV